MIRAVLFDCDGVLIDSERVHQACNAKFVEENHLGFDPKAFALIVGSSPEMRERELWGRLYALARTDWTLEEFKANFFAFKASHLPKMPFADIIYPEAPGVLRALKAQGIKVACASSSSGDYVHTMVAECGVEDCFDLLVTGRDFAHSKPAPDIYLFCANSFGLSPEECLVVEDSPYGITAGKAAGMTVLARREDIFGLDQSQADRQINDLRGVLAYVEEQNGTAD